MDRRVLVDRAVDRRALVARARRRAFVPLVAATAVLIYAWATVDPLNCAPSAHGGEYCRLLGYKREFVLTLSAGVVAAAAVALAVAVPASWTGRLPDVGFPGRCPRSLPPIVAVTAAYAPWLFWGELVASQWLWLLLAVPFAPFLGLFAVLDVLFSNGPTPGLSGVLLVILLAAVVQAAGYYALARGVDRAAGHVRNVVTSHRNS